MNNQTNFVIQNKSFTSGSEIRYFINKNIRDRYSCNCPINPQDLSFIKDLLSYICTNEYLNLIEAIVLDYYFNNKVFFAVIKGQKQNNLPISEAINNLVSQNSLIFTSKEKKHTLIIYPNLGKENYSKRERIWEVVADEKIRDAYTLEEIGRLKHTSYQKLEKYFQGRDYPYKIIGKIDIFPSLILTSNKSGNTLKIISNTNSAKGLIYKGTWLIQSNGEVIDYKTNQAIGHLDQDSFQKIAKQLKESRYIKVTGKTENFTSFKRYRQNALRAIIRPQIEDYKRKQKQEYPDFDFSNYQVDHEDYTFAEIVEDWMLKFNLTWEDLQLSWNKKFKKQKLANNFYNYHQENAKLKYIPKEQNQKKIKPSDNIYSNQG